MSTRRSRAEPCKIKVVEPHQMTRPQRVRAIAEAGFNTFLLRGADASIDLLTDSGTNVLPASAFDDGSRRLSGVS